MYRLVVCALLGALLALATPALAGTSTWQGANLPNLPAGGTRSWIDVNNWVGGVVPPAGDTDDFGLTGDGNVTLDADQTESFLRERFVHRRNAQDATDRLGQDLIG